LFLTDAGLIAAAGTTSGQREIGIMAWDVASGEERAIITTVPGISSSDLSYLQPLSVAIDPSDGQLIVGVASEFTANGQGSFVGALNLGDELLRCPPCTGTRPAWLRTVELLPDLVVPSPDGLHIAVADFTRGRVTVIDALLGAPVFEPVSYRNPRSVEWSPDSSRLLVTGGDNPTVFDATNGTVLLTLPSRGETSSAASFRPETDEIAVVSGSGGFRIHRTTPTGGDIATSGVRVARALAAGGTHFLTGQEVVGMGVTTEHMVVSISGAGVAVFDRETGAYLHSRDFEIEVGLPAAVAKDAGTVAGIYANGSVTALEAATLRDAARLPGCAAPTGSSADGRFFVLDRSLGIGDACAAGDGVAGVFDIEDEAVTVEFGSERIVHGAVSNVGSDGTRYAALAVYEDPAKPGRVDLWDVESATLVASLDQAARPGILPAFVSFSPDARYLAVGTNGPGVVVLDVPALADGAELADAIVFDREVHASRAPRAIVTDDGVLATGSGDGVYRFWDLESGEMTMQLETTGVLGAGVFDFSPDFASFYYEDGGGIIRQMPTEIDQLVATATSLIGRSLTDAECRDYLHLDACDPADD
ncbi:MAG TPA: WD40 repeat domain-containing protein, partial [Candidatus Limnocylindria bacterium]|nr:WD40 repeat domain-containing protein [Candidatus Limnocylindria bacterium]